MLIIQIYVGQVAFPVCILFIIAPGETVASVGIIALAHIFFYDCVGLHISNCVLSLFQEKLWTRMCRADDDCVLFGVAFIIGFILF